jgi:uridine kinase
MFNSALVYELAVLKPQVELLLRAIPQAAEEVSEAERLLGILFYFLSAPADPVPSNSILREFIGGSGFQY